MSTRTETCESCCGTGSNFDEDLNDGAGGLDECYLCDGTGKIKTIFRIRYCLKDGTCTYNKGEAKRWKRSGKFIYVAIVELFDMRKLQPVIFNDYVARIKEQRKQRQL